METVATPLALVVAEPAAFPSTVKLTVAPETAAPPAVRVNVAENVTGPAEPNATEAGLGAASAREVATVEAFTVIPGSVPLIEAVPVSVAVIDCAPAVFRVALNVWVPLSLPFPVVNV